MAYSCTLKIGSTTYTDLHRIIDFRTLSIVSPLCSTDKKSGKGTMSVSVVANRNIVYYRLFMTALLGAQEAQTVGDCEFTITEDSTVVFRGFLDLSNIQINSAKLPQNLTLSAIDKSTLLDKKIRYNHYWENKKRSEIVQDLLAYLGTDYGISVTFLTNALPDSKKIKYFAVAEGKEQTYREVIDKILLESAGYVLWYDPVNDGFSIREIPTSTTGLTPRIVNYLVDNQLQTKSAIYNKDGVLLSFPNVVERPNTNIFTENINTSLEDDGTVKGEKVQPGQYYPTDGDVKEIYQEYSIADRAYISGESRLQNENLKLLYAKNATYYLASNPSLSIAPPIPLVKWKGTVEYFPDRAKILFVNNNVREANVSVFSITGTAVYQNYLNKVTVGRLDPSANGAACTNPEEYLADTIQYKEGDSDYSEAINFAKWYYRSLNYGQTTSSWAEIRGNAYIGEVVYVAHKETGIMMPHVIVQITNQSKNNSTIRMDKIVAISIYGWEEFVYDTGVSASGKGGEQVQRPNQWFSGTVLKGDTTARGVAGIIGDWYLNTVTYDIYQCTTAGSIVSAIWTYRGNIKGEDADVTSQTYEVQYGLSTSDTEFIFPSGTYGYDSTHSYGYDSDNEYGYRNYEWDSSLNNWYHGLYVWTRIKITDADGNVTYGDPTYAKDVTQGLIESCVIELSALPSSYASNKRKAYSQYLFLSIKDIGYKGSLTIHTNTGIFARYNTATDTWEDLSNSLIINFNGTSTLLNYGIKLPYAIENNVVVEGEFTEWDLEQFTISSLSISPSIEKTPVIQMKPVYAKADLPTLADPDDADTGVTDDNYLIDGDYVITKYVTLTPNQGVYYDDLDIEISYDPNRIYYTRSGDIFTIANISGFDGTTTYYYFRVYPWRYNGTTHDWDRTENGEIKYLTVQNIVKAAKEQSDAYPNANVDYSDCLYAYEAYIEELSVGLINAGDILAHDIKSHNYSEAADGTPITGYYLHHGENAETDPGDIRSVGGIYANMNVRGVLNLTKQGGEVGAQIRHPALETTDAVKGDPTGKTSILNAYNMLDLYSMMITYFSSTGFNQVSLCPSVDTEDSDIDIVGFKSSNTAATAVNFGQHIVRIGNGQTYTSGGSATIILPFNSVSSVIEIVSLSETTRMEMNGTIKVYKNGTLYISVNVSRTGGKDPIVISYESFNGFQIGDVVSLVCEGGLKVTGGDCALKIGTYSGLGFANSWVNENFSQQGIYTHSKTTGWHYLGYSKVYSETNEHNYLIYDPVFRSQFYREQLCVAFDTNQNINYSLPTDLAAYSYYYDDAIPSVRHDLVQGSTYKVEGLFYDKDYNQYVPLFMTVDYLGTQISVVMDNGETYVFNKNEGSPLYGRIAIEETNMGIKTKDIYPDSGSDYNVGTPANPYAAGFFGSLVTDLLRHGTPDINYSDLQDYQGSIPLGNGLFLKYGFHRNIAYVSQIQYTNPFPNATLSVFTTYVDHSGATSGVYEFLVHDITKSSFGVGERHIDSSGTISSDNRVYQPFFWLALGY